MVTTPVSCLGNPIDRRPEGCSPWGYRELDMSERLSTHLVNQGGRFAWGSGKHFRRSNTATRVYLGFVFGDKNT